MNFIDRVFCKECAIAVFSRSLLQIQLVLLGDTKVHELFSGLLALSLGIALLAPEGYFPAGTTFSYLFTEGYTTTQVNWGIGFIIVGALRAFSTVFGSLRIRKWMSLVSLYFWLLIIYYLVTYGYYSIFVLFPFMWLAIFSIFTFVSVWKRLNGTI